MKHVKKYEDSNFDWFNVKNIIRATLSDDWEGLYIDGELINQGHSINYEDVIHKMINLKINLDGYKFAHLEIRKNNKYYELSDDVVEELGISNLPEQFRDFTELLHNAGYDTNLSF